MPVFYQQEIDSKVAWAIWEITEPDAFFLEQVPEKKEAHHPLKRRQHLAGRYLLPFLYPDFPLSEILIADTRKPYLPNDSYHFSISHCGDFAAAIASRTHRVGIDIEVMQPKLARIQHKFIAAAEWALLQDLQPLLGDLALQTMLWSVKEALFKWYSLGSVNFKADMPLMDKPVQTGTDQYLFPMRFEKDMQVNIDVSVQLFGSLVCSQVVKL
jgi:phosphopantetheinyl transferase